MPSELDGVVQYDKDELKEILRTGAATVIDVRTDEEYTEGHIPGVPLHSLQTLQDWESGLDPTTPYVFVCRSGTRSQKVALHLQANGFSQVANYKGGMLAWDGDVKTGDTP